MTSFPGGRAVDASTSDAAFEMFRRAYDAGEPAVFFDGVPAAARTDAERALCVHSYIAVRPSAGLCVRAERAWTRDGSGAWTRARGDAWELARALVRPTSRADVPFAHGVAGLVTYDAGRLIERLPEHAIDDIALPEILLFRFDAVWAVPRVGPATLHVHPEADASLRAELEALAARPPAAIDRDSSAAARLEARTTPKAFERMVVDAQELIRAGDVFQVNVSHRLEADTPLDPLSLYARLRDANPAPFAAFFASGALPYRDGPFHVLSSSPERLFRLRAGRLEARPIAGTRKRGCDDAADAGLVEELRTDPKEQAEHVMLVDLARNDLGRVARFGSVRVPHLFTIETYRTVHHLVSVVEADLDEGKDAVDALRALFPGGTITGAPKVRAMEIIETLEPVRRGVYTGSLGWMSDGGDADFNILIRTLLLQEGRVHLQAGAGIVDESVPEREYNETMAKARGLLRALGIEEEQA